MAKTAQKTPRFKRQRRLGTELPGLGKAGALDRRPYPPGQHGNQRRKLSEYALRLEEKQKIIFHYGLREEQLRRFVRDSKRGLGTDWVDTLIGKLESRLDNLVFRLGFAVSIRSARQLVRHGHVLVNGKKLSIGSAVIRPGSKITLTPEAYKGTVYLAGKAAPRLELPDYLSKEVDGETEIGTLREVPHANHIPFHFETGLLAEYYAARKA
ncbi:MAG: 30S ribosomal protein S4 [Bdellovibrionales bacterium]|nr:30S ribosomal protein S4 [Bdellovibrionales bacterium]